MSFEFITNSGRKISLLNEEQNQSCQPRSSITSPTSSKSITQKMKINDHNSIIRRMSDSNSKPHLPPFEPRLQPSEQLFSSSSSFYSYYPQKHGANITNHSISTPHKSLTAISDSEQNTETIVRDPAVTKTKNLKRYICRNCNNTFTTSGHLARHMRIHTGEKKHVCPQAGCEARFSRQDNCLQHYKTHQGPKKSNTRKRVGDSAFTKSLVDKN